MSISQQQFVDALAACTMQLSEELDASSVDATPIGNEGVQFLIRGEDGEASEFGVTVHWL